jgi:hypothetical protein
MLPQDPEREAVGRSISALLMARQIKSSGQIHAPTLLSELGALAGFSVQMSIRKAIIEPQKLDPDTLLVEALTRNGEKFFFSDLMNFMLFENMEAPPYSVWAYVADAVPADTWMLLPDIPEIVSNAARSIGSRRFGVPRVPPPHVPHKLPRAALDEHWAMVRDELIASRRDAAGWPYDLAAAARWQMLTGRETLELPLAATIVMEAAVPMSKVDPTSVPGA